MKCKALICEESQHISLQEVVISSLQPNEIRVKNLFSGVSVGTELSLVRGKVTWGPYPICTGYQAVGVVEEVGSSVTNLHPGDKVYHRGWQGQGSMEWAGQRVSCTSGAHSEYTIAKAIHPTHAPALLPDGIDESVASLFVLPSVGLHGVDMAGVTHEDIVVVFGVGMIGQGVVAMCALRGARVVAVDLDETKLRIARQLGAEHTINGTSQDVAAGVNEISPGGASVVFEATGIPGCIDSAVLLCRCGGKFIYQGDYGDTPQPFLFLEPHIRQVRAFFPSDDGYQLCRSAVMRLLQYRALKLEQTVTHRIRSQDADVFMNRLNSGEIPDALGVIIEW